jgi:hypothetical protein
MKLSKRHVAIIGILLGITGIVSCNSQNTRVSDSQSTVPSEAEYASCIEPTIAGYDEQESKQAQVAQNQPSQNSANRNAVERPLPETADCILPEL